MALFKFTEAILASRPIDVYGEGRMQRDFTYAGDNVTGVLAALDTPAACTPTPPPAASPLADPQPGQPAAGGAFRWRKASAASWTDTSTAGRSAN